jgi:hypothetical protein
MAENKTSIDGVIEKLAIISEATDELFPDGRKVVVFELKLEDFKKVQYNFRQVDHGHKQFKIDISGVEFIFLLDELLSDEKDKT